MFCSILNWLAYRIGLDPRGLFTFFDGRRWRYADPMVLARRIWSIPGFESADARQLIVSDIGSMKLQGFAEIASAVRRAFVIQSLESGGLTDLECERLLSRFESYLGDLKKNGNPGQTSPQFTVPTPPLDGITNVVLDSGSTSTDSTLGWPG